MQKRHEEKEKQRALLLCMLAIGISGLGFLWPVTSVVLSIAFASLLIFWANPGGLPALAILWVRATDFLPQLSEFISQAPSTELLILGAPLTLQLFTLIWITVRILFEWIHQPQTYKRSRWVTKASFLWLLLFFITILSAFWGRSLTHENWTQPLRASLSLASLFYGIILVPKLKIRLWVLKWLLWIAAIVLVLIASGLYWNHIAFFYTPLGALGFWYALRQKRWVLGVICVSTSILVAFFSGDTLTLIVSTMLGLIAGFWLFHPDKSLSYRVTSNWTRIALPISVFLLIIVLVTDFSPAYKPSSERNLIERFQSKLFLDRGILWKHTWNTIIEDPKIVPPAGEPVPILSSSIYTQNELWKVHVHNSYLEMIRQSGFFGGGVFFILVVWLWLKARKALLESEIPIVRLFIGATLITILVGATIGFYPFDFYVGSWVWMWIGIALGWKEEKTNSKVMSTAPSYQSKMATGS